ncbi:MAG: pyridoxal-phosphate dependent enzyme [Bacteroidetes bacterium]|nr:MAG: pyridoxal-phosphate dependent enzyme [Bacteroidota bacterium]
MYPYLTEGIGEDILPENCDMSVIDQIVKVTDKDAALMTRRLARLEGLFVGWSCGSAVQGGLAYARAHLKPDDLMVIILPDHGTRYLGKVYNDQWMQTHNFLDEGTMLTAAQILALKGTHRPLLSLHPDQNLGEAIALMRQEDVTQLPVVADGQVVGALTETRALNAILDDPSQKEAPLSRIMSDPFPFVLPSTRLEVISKLINKENPAVLVQGEAGQVDIITKYDLISALAR